MNIGQASEASAVSERMIRHYEKIGLVPTAARSRSGYRDYSAGDVRRLRFIADARGLGFSMAEIGELLLLLNQSYRSVVDRGPVLGALYDALQRKSEALEAMRQALDGLANGGDAWDLDRPDADWSDALRPAAATRR